MNQVFSHQVDKFGRQNEEYKKQMVNGVMPYVQILTTHKAIIVQYAETVRPLTLQSATEFFKKERERETKE